MLEIRENSLIQLSVIRGLSKRIWYLKDSGSSRCSLDSRILQTNNIRFYSWPRYNTTKVVI